MTGTSPHSWRARIERLLQVDPDAKPRVYQAIFDSSEIASLNYWLELFFSAGIATLGLVLNSPAVVIGAMLISPLMGPLMGAGLALAAADLYLGIRSLLNLAASVAGAVAFAGALVWLLPFHIPTAEILARTQPNLLDLGVALLSGLAGSLILYRGGGGGGVTALPGVAIAVALMPPLCTAGFGVGSGFHWAIISGAGLLFLTNLAAIVASAFLVFFLGRMDAPELQRHMSLVLGQRASPDRLYRFLESTPRKRALSAPGKLGWRVVMPLAALLVLFVPLRQALMQVRDESIARTAVRDAIRRMVPAEAVVTQRVQISPERVYVGLVVTDAVEAAKIEEARRFLLKRTGKDVELGVRKVAGAEELALLRERLSAPPPPPVTDLNYARRELLAHLEKPLKAVWPIERAELADYELGFSPEAVLVRIRYRAPEPLGAAAEEMLSRTLQTGLELDGLSLVLEYEKPPRPPGKKAASRKGGRS